MWKRGQVCITLLPKPNKFIDEEREAGSGNKKQRNTTDMKIMLRNEMCVAQRC